MNDDVPMHTIASLLERITSLEDALRPFARLAVLHERRAPEARVFSSAIGDVSVSDLRRAADVLVDRGPGCSTNADEPAST